MARLTKAREPKFAEGDRVSLWNRSDAGTVDEAWIDDNGNEIVAVCWDVSGCVSDVRAYRLQHAGSAGRAAIQVKE